MNSGGSLNNAILKSNPHITPLDVKLASQLKKECSYPIAPRVVPKENGASFPVNSEITIPILSTWGFPEVKNWKTPMKHSQTKGMSALDDVNTVNASKADHAGLVSGFGKLRNSPQIMVFSIKIL